jgi:hypothetical protein
MDIEERLKRIEESLLTLHSGITTAMQEVATILSNMRELTRETADAVIRMSQSTADEDGFDLGLNDWRDS